VEGLERREVLSASVAAPVLGPALVAVAGSDAHQAASLLPLQITSVAVQDGQLVANGVLGATPFTAPLTLTASPSSASPTAAAAATPILDLHVGAIHLNLLGLRVDTSEICLSISAQPGPGNLLGNLLSNVANLLNNGTSLGGILGGLTASQTSTLTSGLTNLLNGALDRLTARSAVTGATGNILHLAVGPLDLNLLGLKVHLDNCHNGPVTVDISAVPGPGNLLGNLLSDLSHLLDNNVVGGVVNGLLGRIGGLIRSLAGTPAISLLPLSITGVTVQDGQLVANGLLGSTPFTAPLTLSTPSAAGSTLAAAAATPILNLQLGPIHLDLLGLTVDTSPICLAITAHSGPGNLLGNLLTDVANLLNGGSLLGTILGGLTAAQFNSLTTGLTNLLNGVFGSLTSSSALAGATGNILHLALGPVDLNLLGLEVHLDNCHNGPVTVDISAVPGPGNLLGNLLGGLTHLLDRNAPAGAISGLLGEIGGLIGGLV